MLLPMATTALCVALIRRASSGDSVRGSASRWFVGANLREVLDVLGGADDRGDRPVSFRGPADVDHGDAIRSRRDELEVRLDVGGGGELAIAAHAEPEMRLRRGHLRGERRRGECLHERQRRRDDRTDHG